MKTTSLRELASDRKMTMRRAAVEVLAAAGEIPRRYPVVIRRQLMPAALIEQARHVHSSLISAGPRRPLP